jgi:hypothetical protein
MTDDNGETKSSGGTLPETGKPTIVARTQFKVRPRFELQLAFVLLTDIYSKQPRLVVEWIVGLTITAAFIIAAFILGGYWIAFAVLGLILDSCGLAFQLRRVIVLSKQIDPKSHSRGGTFTTRYAKSFFQVGYPSGEFLRIDYSEIRELHARGQFFIFRSEAGMTAILPLGILPRGELTWLLDRVTSRLEPLGD